MEEEIIKEVNDDIRKCLYALECLPGVYDTNLKYAYRKKLNYLCRISNLFDNQSLKIKVLEQKLNQLKPNS